MKETEKVHITIGIFGLGFCKRLVSFSASMIK